MYRKTTLSISLVVLVGTLFLTACSPKANAEPTPDPAAIMTQAVQTVQAQLTQTALAMPTAIPTNTMEPTSTTAPATATLAVPVTPAATLIVPSATLAPINIPDQLLLVDQDPKDNNTFAPSQAFQMKWVVKNVGTTTWSKDYQMRFYAGDRMSAADIKLPKEVKPNETVDLIITLTAPKNAGDYISSWVLTNTNGVNFGSFYVVIKVAGSTPTATSVATATVAVTVEPSLTATTEVTAEPSPTATVEPSPTSTP